MFKGGDEPDLRIKEVARVLSGTQNHDSCSNGNWKVEREIFLTVSVS